MCISNSLVLGGLCVNLQRIRKEEKKRHGLEAADTDEFRRLLR